MDKKSDIRKGRTCSFSIIVELVFFAVRKSDVFDKQALSVLETIFRSVCEDFQVNLVQMRGEPDHLHLLVEIPPKVSVSMLVNSLKCVSSRLLKKERKDLTSKYWNGVLWSPSYIARSHLGRVGEKFENCSEEESGS